MYVVQVILVTRKFFSCLTCTMYILNCTLETSEMYICGVYKIQRQRTLYISAAHFIYVNDVHSFNVREGRTSNVHSSRTLKKLIIVYLCFFFCFFIYLRVALNR